jgi:hypothetical protein
METGGGRHGVRFPVLPVMQQEPKHFAVWQRIAKILV